MKCFLSGVFVLIICFTGYAQYKIERFVLGGGGGKVFEQSYIVNGTVGQSFPGKSSTLLFNMNGGFWYTYSELTGVNDNMIPRQFMLYQNYPNPFNPATKIKYELPEPSAVTLKVYNILGELTAVLVEALQNAGSYEVEWNASNCSSGFYICRIEAGKYTSVKKLVLLK